MDPGAGDDLDDEFDLDEAFVPLENAADEEVSQVVEKLTKKRKRNSEKTKAVKKQKVEGPADKEGVEPSVATQSPAIQAEYVKSLQLKVYKDVSEVELEELRFSESCFVDTSEYDKPRGVDTLPTFIAEVAPTLQTRLSQRSANKGAPTLLLITSSALRAAEIVKALRPMRGTKGGEVAKLFAKHFKLDEHAEYLRRTSICAGVGTAGRIGRLLGETDALSLKALSHVVIDASHRDAKTMSIFDIADTRSSLIRDVLGNSDLKKAIDSGKVTVILF